MEKEWYFCVNINNAEFHNQAKGPEISLICYKYLTKKLICFCGLSFFFFFFICIIK